MLMGFNEAVKTCFAKYLVLEGRAGRAEFWWFLLAVILAGALASVLDALAYDTAPDDIGLVGILVLLVTLIPSVTVTVRRLHDTGRSGYWYVLFLCAPILMILLSIPMILLSEVFSLEAIGALGLLFLFSLLALFIWFICWMAAPSEPRANRYGPNPFDPADGPTGMSDDTQR